MTMKVQDSEQLKQPQPVSSALADDLTDYSEILGVPPPGNPAFRGGMVPYNVKLSRTKGPNSLPTLPVEPTIHHTFRFQRVSGNSYTVTSGDILKCLVAAGSATQVRPIFRTIRIKKVTVRGSCVAGDTSSVSLRFLGSNTNEIGYMDQTMKIDVNACVARKPPNMSLASFWIDVDTSELTTQLFVTQYYGSGEFYVDLQLEAIMDCTRYINYSLNIGTGMISGGIYAGDLAVGLEPVGKTPA
jgi:hypothetical protein